MEPIVVAPQTGYDLPEKRSFVAFAPLPRKFVAVPPKHVVSTLRNPSLVSLRKFAESTPPETCYDLPKWSRMVKSLQTVKSGLLINRPADR